MPYKGTPEALTDTMAGRVTYFFSPISAALPQIKDGKLVALAVSSAKRSSLLPDVPTIAESGLPGFDYNLWVGMFAPAGTAARDRREDQRRTSSVPLASPEIKERFANLGAEPMPMTPAEFRTFMRDEVEDVGEDRQGGRHQGAVSIAVTASADRWPALPLDAWQDTHATLHLWLQIVGKIRLAQTPWLNHCWHVTLYVTPSGLTTGPVPHGERSFRIDFDFLRQRLVIRTSDGGIEGIPLVPQTVAAFYASVMGALDRLGVPVRIYAVPNEIPDPIPFAQDETHRAYDARYAQRYWRILAQTERVFTEFRAAFIGKCSPVHFFWGAPDLAVTRFSGRNGAGASRRDSEPAGSRDARSVFARSVELRLLGGWRRGAVSGVLRVCLSDARGLRRCECRAQRGVLQQGTRRVHPALRRGAHVGLAGRDADDVPAIDVRRGRGSRQVGSRGAGAPARLRASRRAQRLTLHALRLFPAPSHYGST